ncbi:MAG: hypothetical protein KIS87_10460 [Phycisphaeraceae bacterium]|nr:hypothetical protein [Phycisphaeraceae bacterium]
MKDFLFVSWDFSGRGGVKAALAMLRRCDLRHVARQRLDIPLDDDPDLTEEERGNPSPNVPWTTGCDGHVRLTTDDPRLARLLAELERLGIEPFTRVDRVYSKKDLEAPWLRIVGGSMMVGTGNVPGQKWDFSKACRECGAGAIPIAPLAVQGLDRMPKSGWCVTLGGFIVLEARLAAKLADAELTGFSVEPVRKHTSETAHDRYRWLRIPCKWPEPVERPGCRLHGRCEVCRRPQFIAGRDGLFSLHFERPPRDARDFNAWQGSVLPGKRAALATNRPTGDYPELVISQRAYSTLKEAKLRSLRCEPVFFD